jgi:hypothetical protein
MNLIKFTPKTPEVEANVPSPDPAKKCFPDWYKRLPKFENNRFQIKILNQGVQSNATAKSCMPFLDTLTTGYIQKTWCDIMIDVRGENDVNYAFSNSPEIISHRDKISIPDMCGNEFHQIEFVWRQPWVPKLPDGYSLLYTHPLNRSDLPFVTLSGIIDNDRYINETAGNHPFFIKKGFSGIIPAGTPMFQMIPIKREKWQSITTPVDKHYEYTKSGVYRFFVDGYKKLFWNKKEYN